MLRPGRHECVLEPVSFDLEKRTAKALDHRSRVEAR